MDTTTAGQLDALFSIQAKTSHTLDIPGLALHLPIADR
jgi:hypothetical protein